MRPASENHWRVLVGIIAIEPVQAAGDIISRHVFIGTELWSFVRWGIVSPVRKTIRRARSLGCFQDAWRLSVLAPDADKNRLCQLRFCNYACSLVDTNATRLTLWWIGLGSTLGHAVY